MSIIRHSLKDMRYDWVELLRERGVRPSAQRLAVARYVLETDEHPSAERVWRKVRKRFPVLSRATVYNTVNLFVEKGLLRELVLAQGRIVFDPKTEPHHHFIERTTGAIYDVPWNALQVSNVDALDGFVVSEYQVVMRGRKRC